jgi:Zn-dependent alcohol dehydrogenase
MPFSLPAVLGHEGAGVVEAVGSAVTKVAPGVLSSVDDPFAARGNSS